MSTVPPLAATASSVTNAAAENPPHAPLPEVWLIRHGETAWSKSGQHTGLTDIPLTENGRAQARALAPALDKIAFAEIWCSPLGRAQETCALSGAQPQTGAGATSADGAPAKPAGVSGIPGIRIVQDLHEWDYGIYEGRTTPDIRRTDPKWAVWDSPMPRGEDLAAAGARANRVVSALHAALRVPSIDPSPPRREGTPANRALDVQPHRAAVRIAVFSHGHFLRVLAGAWIGDPELGRRLVLDTATVSVLGFERETPVIRRWNAPVSTPA